MTAFFLWLAFNETPTELFKYSGPFNNCLLNDSFLVLAPASKTILILSGLCLELGGEEDNF